MASIDLTKEWLESHGFVKEPVIGYVRKLADGPDDTSCILVVGNTPWNHPGVMIYLGGFGYLTNAGDTDEIATLIRLLDKGRVDHPYIEEIDADQYDAMGE